MPLGAARAALMMMTRDIPRRMRRLMLFEAA